MSHWEFEPGELALPIHKILWAPTNSAHYNHLHVEGYPPINATLDSCTSKWTEAITTIRGALDGEFGEGDHWMVNDDTLGWTHMGVYNCRPIAGTDTPSQHAFSNAIDIGPYYGVAQQQKFYDFLTKPKEDEMNLDSEDLAAIKALLVEHDNVFDYKNSAGQTRRVSGLAVNSAWHVDIAGQRAMDLLANLAKLPTSDVAAIAKAVNDELARRTAS